MVNLPHWAYTAAWIAWAVWFVIWESLALLDKGENETLSGHMKNLMWQGNGRPTVAWFIVGPALVWLIWHFYHEVKNYWQT
jgi:hypothetical protein